MRPNDYNDGRHISTIGIGYAAVVLGRDGRWVVKPSLEADMRAAKIPLGGLQKKTLHAIADELNKGKPVDAKGFFRHAHLCEFFPLLQRRFGVYNGLNGAP